MTVALYPGSFDPFHAGHRSVVEQVVHHVDRLVVGILGNPAKTAFLPLARRAELVAASLADLPGVEVVQHHGLVVDLATAVGARLVLRGAGKELADEVLMAAMNHRVTGMRTVFVAPSPTLAFIASRNVRALVLAGRVEDVAHLVPAPVLEALRALAAVDWGPDGDGAGARAPARTPADRPSTSAP
jgi:pantetheine-phosphate adenylyltransferase